MGLLDYDPATRYTARQALKHSFLQATFDSEERDLSFNLPKSSSSEPVSQFLDQQSLPDPRKVGAR